MARRRHEVKHTVCTTDMYIYIYIGICYRRFRVLAQNDGIVGVQKRCGKIRWLDMLGHCIFPRHFCLYSVSFPASHGIPAKSEKKTNTQNCKPQGSEDPETWVLSLCVCILFFRLCMPRDEINCKDTVAKGVQVSCCRELGPVFCVNSWFVLQCTKQIKMKTMKLTQVKICV